MRGRAIPFASEWAEWRAARAERRWQQQFSIRGLSDEAYRRWEQSVGVDELTQMLLWTRGTRGDRRSFPDSASRFGDQARTILLGLRMGDDRARFAKRMRANSSPNGRGWLTSALELRTRFAHTSLSLGRLHAWVERWAQRSIAAWAEQDERETWNALPFRMHLSKYDPAHSVAGYADDGTWTDFSDVGGTFREGTLTLARYEQVEAAHIEVLVEVCREADVRELTTRRLGGSHRSKGGTDTTIQLEDLGPALRRAIRHESDDWIWCDPHLRAYVSVGYDFHFYAGSHRDSPAAVALARDRALFPDVAKSNPWLAPD